MDFKWADKRHNKNNLKMMAVPLAWLVCSKRGTKSVAKLGLDPGDGGQGRGLHEGVAIEADQELTEGQILHSFMQIYWNW